MGDDDTVVIGAAAGAWGDTSFAPQQMLASGRCDYVMFEALAEITMGILARAKNKTPELGYATGVVEMIGRHLPAFREQNVRVVTNAGGMNPAAAARSLRSMAAEAGVEVRIASIEGDDLLGRGDELGAGGVGEVPAGAISFSAYLGARPIAAALAAGAEVVIAGRCVDSALALGPLIHEFGWDARALDRLSGGTLAGHLLECGPQSTGGLLTDWRDIASWEDLGFPLAECRADGSFVLTKPDGTGGLVDLRTVSEQLLYEIGDPRTYTLPDVVCDWSEVTLEQVGVDRVAVRGARGRPPPATLKACAQVPDGYKLKTLSFLAGRDAADKARRLGEDVRRRAERLLAREGLARLRAFELEVLGAESTYGPRARAGETREVVVKLALHHDDRAALDAIVREIPSFGMAVPGFSGGGRGLARPTPLLRLHSAFVPRGLVRARVELDGEEVPFEDVESGEEIEHESAPSPPAEPFPVDDPVELPLIAIAHARSGDKGDRSNIGVRARHPDFLPLMRDQLTAEAVAEYFAHRIDGSVERWDLPGIDAMNFLLYDALGGGGIASLRMDPQGKAYGQQLLDFVVRVPRAWLDHPGLAEHDRTSP